MPTNFDTQITAKLATQLGVRLMENTMNAMNPLDFNIVLKREYKKWKNKYYSAKAHSDYEKMERCHAEMQKILKYANEDMNKA